MNKEEKILSWIKETEEVILSHGIYNCQFLDKMCKGQLSYDELKAFLSQQFYVSRQFSRCIAAAYAGSKNSELFAPLITHFLVTEHWGSTMKGAHWKLFIKTLKFFQLTKEDLLETEPYDQTKKFLDYRFEQCSLGGDTSLSILAFGHELANTKIFNSYRQGFEKVPNITPEALEYFEVHIEDDGADYQVLVDILVKDLLLDQGEYFDTRLEILQSSALRCLERRSLWLEEFLMNFDKYELNYRADT